MRCWKTDLTPKLNAAIAAFVALGILVFFYVFKFDSNITGFFRLGSIIPLSPYVDAKQALINNGEAGYDGQFFLSMALDPFLQNDGTIAALDSPPYRYRRIFYALLGHLLGLGNRQVIPYMLVLINYLCIIALVWMASWGLKQTEEPRWHGLLVLCVPGVWMTLWLSTADLLSSTLLMGAICCYRYSRSNLTSLSISLACLTRETMVLGWLALVICSIQDRNWRLFWGLMGAIVPVVVWNSYVSARLVGGVGPSLALNFSLPFVNIFHKFTVLVQTGLKSITVFEACGFTLLISAFGLALALSRFSPSKNRIIFLCTCLYATVFIFSSDAILGYFLGYSRVFMDAFFLLLLIVNSPNKTLKVMPLVAGVVVSLPFIFLGT